jgi:glycosyltransferase involved in cell wall biosynthesis
MENPVKETTPSSQITIVIGTLNRPQVVMQLIQQLVEESKKTHLEVIVVDQSSEENVLLLKSQFPQLDNFALIHLEKPNTCKYLNYGWKNAKAPIVLYLDDDVTITEKTIQSHIITYDKHSIHAVAGRVINDNEKISTDEKVGKALWFGAQFTKNFTYEKSTFVDFPYGCNMSFRKSTLVELNGFDEKLSPPIYSYNEVDMGYRISKKYNNSILFSPEALVYHHQYKRGGTRNDFEIKKVIECNNFNYGYFLGKNFNWIENIICFLRRLPYQLLKEPTAIPDIINGFTYGKKG